MALFKVLRGSSSSLESQPFHDGYAYFTPDDGRFYIDVKLTEAPSLYFQMGTEGNDTIYRIEIESATWAALSNTKSDKGHQHVITDVANLATILTTGSGSFTQTGTTVNVDLHADWAETSSTAPGYIKNKPTIINTVITMSEDTKTMFITSPVINGDEVSY